MSFGSLGRDISQSGSVPLLAPRFPSGSKTRRMCGPGAAWPIELLIYRSGVRSRRYQSHRKYPAAGESERGVTDRQTLHYTRAPLPFAGRTNEEQRLLDEMNDWIRRNLLNQFVSCFDATAFFPIRDRHTSHSHCACQ